jgi:glycosyltransferase involved in cell wall biosynthesis
VLDALAHGVPVVTTAAGTEGLHGVAEAVITVRQPNFAGALADLLADPKRREQLAARGRQAVLDHHTPQQAAAARLALIERL